MKKIIIKKVNNELLAWVDEVTPCFVDDNKESVFAVFDVAECYIHC